MSSKKYWKNFSELDNSKEYFVKNENEFNENLLPIEELDSKGILDVKTPRRDFLKYLGFSTAAAVLAASCKTAVTKSVPFLFKPEEIIPGVADYYATSFVCENDILPIVAKVRDGRPIKIEGNALSKITNGGTSSRAQASVLSLYDSFRLRNPLSIVANKQTEISYTEADKSIKEKLATVSKDKQIVVLTPTLTSVVSKNILKDFAGVYPNAKAVYYDPISYNSLLKANKISFGAYSIPSYNFDKANVIVSLDADFLGTWLSPVEFSSQWAKNRKIDSNKTTMSKHYQFEPLMSMTGANADERFVCKPSEINKIALALYNALTQKSNSDLKLSEKLLSAIKKVAQDLSKNSSKSIVVSNSQNTNTQVIVNAINKAINSYGNTIDWSNTYSYLNSSDEEFETLVGDMKKGSVGAIFFVDGCNPSYNSHFSKEFNEAIKTVSLKVSFSDSMDETSQLCDYILPSHHSLESWGDAELKSNETYFLQPTISPLFQTRYWQQTFLNLSGKTTTFEDYFKNYWVTTLGSQDKFDQALQNGVFENSKKSESKNYSATSLEEAIKSIQDIQPTTGIEVSLYQKVSIGTGRMANNPWLQEVPDPITKTTWDNYLVISVAMANKLGIDVNDKFEVEVDKPVFDIVINNEKLSLPINVIPGVHPETIGIAVGYGRTNKIGRAGGDIGKNVYQLTSIVNKERNFYNTVSNVSLNSSTFPLALTQSHNSYEGRTEVVKEFTLEEFLEHPNEIIEERQKEFNRYGNGVQTEDDFRKNATMYPNHEKHGIKWGMSIDLNLCTGCNACVVACTAENNVSIVGKKQVLKAHEMQWIRIDRYFSGDVDNPDVIFQPMICQHCDNAPCENVCPVAATNHSTEGLNQMTYNRCIGTRYCANNCPFKVRRFNWADWNGADSFKDNQRPLVEEGSMDEIVLDMNDDLTRMVLNPDVTVRSRGVIEKCTFCVQRLQEGKLNSKKENRPLEDGDIQTACMQSCPTRAIEFGNVNNKNSKLYKMRNETDKQRLFYSLEQIHVLPNVNYLAKIRNKKTQTSS